MKDFYDIYQLSQKYDFLGSVLFDALNETIKRRQTPISEKPVALSEEFSLLPDKQHQWSAFVRRIDGQDIEMFHEVLVRIRTFLFPVYLCIWNGQSFQGAWSAAQGHWQ